MIQTVIFGGGIAKAVKPGTWSIQAIINFVRSKNRAAKKCFFYYFTESIELIEMNELDLITQKVRRVNLKANLDFTGNGKEANGI